jgi:hypothetical protein
MTQEGEIGMKSSVPEDSRGPGTFFTHCIEYIEYHSIMQQEIHSPGISSNEKDRNFREYNSFKRVNLMDP